MKRAFTLLFAIMLAGQAWAETVYFDFSAVCNDGQTLYYKITSDKEVEVTFACFKNDGTWNGYYGYTEPSGDIIIPETVTNPKTDGITYMVTRIGDHAFSYCSSLTSISIPYSVTSIMRSAFSNTNITSINIPNTVTCIEKNAFRNCSSLTSITIPDGVISIGDYAFFNCSGLTSVVIPNSVTSIGEYAFSNCSGLTSVTISNSVTWFGHYVFSDCSGLTSICYEGNSAPTYQSESFDNVDKTIPVCVSADYSSNTWCGFTNLIKGHNPVSDAGTPATCTGPGLTDGSHCSYCGKIITAQEVIPASHTYITNLTTPTCTEVGFTTHICSVCNHTYNSDTVAANGHTEVVDVAIAASCTEPGKTDGTHCSVCNTVLVAQKEVPALGHVFMYYIYNDDATTTDDGTKTAKCERGCGATDTKLAEGTKLTEEKENEQEPTTPENGTAVAESAANAVNIHAHHNIIVVENATEDIFVYNAMGKLICKDTTPCVHMEITVTSTGIYIVKTGNIVKRVMVN